jgi:hypothetical protein
MTKTTTERMFLDGILNGNGAVTAAAKKIPAIDLRNIARGAGIPAAMCGDGSDAGSVVFAAQCFGGKRWENFQALLSAATQQGN